MPSIARSTSYFTLALIIQKVITFSYFTILARNLEPDSLGKYYLAISITTMFSVIIDIGLSNLLTREVAKVNSTAPYPSPCQGEVVRRLADRRGGLAGEGEDGRAQRLLSAVMAIKLPLAGLALALVWVFVNILDYPVMIKHLVYLSAIPMLLDSFAASFFAVIRGFHNLKYEALASVMYMAMAMLVGLIFLYRGYSLVWIMGALAIASAFYFLYSLLSLALRYGIWPRPDWRSKLIKPYFLLTIPFGLYALLQRLFTYLDTVLLSKLAGDWETGLYQIAFKIVFALQFLPMAFIASLYPAFASYWARKKVHPSLHVPTPCPSGIPLSKGENTVDIAWTCHKQRIPRTGGVGGEDQLVITFERAMNYLAFISLPISAGVIVLADMIIRLFKPEYITAIPILRIIMLSLPLLFLNYPIGALLNACDRQKKNTLNMAIALGAAVSLNFFLIPLYGALGAAVTVFFANLAMFILGLVQVPKIIELRPRKMLLPFFKTLMSALFMAAFVWHFKPVINIFILIPLGALIYFAAMLALRAIRVEDLKSIGKSFGK